MKLNIKKSKVGSTHYNVKYFGDLRDEKNRELSGRILQAETLIKINSNSSYQRQLQTLIHENTHGIIWEYGIEDADDLVEPLSNGFYAFIIDNPKIIHKILDFNKKIRR